MAEKLDFGTCLLAIIHGVPSILYCIPLILQSGDRVLKHVGVQLVANFIVIIMKDQHMGLSSDPSCYICLLETSTVYSVEGSAK